MSDKVHALAEVWREMIGIDHHKSRDGYFAIIKSWSYDHQARYHAEHNAYIGDDLCSDYKDTYAEAESDLIKHLISQIEKQYKWACDVLADKEWASWSGREALHMQQVYKRNEQLINGEAE